jgi:RNA polymerase sigma-70 factor (ECF subfamily)
MENRGKFTDEELILRLNESDENALREIYSRYWNKLIAQARWDLHDEVEAEDCIQEVFIKLWNCRHGLTLKHKLSTYLYRAVKNQTINILEKRYARKNQLPVNGLQAIDLFSPAADESLLEKEMLRVLEAAIEALPEKCSRIYRMSRMEGKSNKEIAAQLDIAEKTVEGHITRAIKQVSTSISLSIVLVLLAYFLQD